MLQTLKERAKYFCSDKFDKKKIIITLLETDGLLCYAIDKVVPASPKRPPSFQQFSKQATFLKRYQLKRYNPSSNPEKNGGKVILGLTLEERGRWLGLGGWAVQTEGESDGIPAVHWFLPATSYYARQYLSLLMRMFMTQLH